MSWGLFVLIMLTVLTVRLVGFTKKHVDKAEWTGKKVDVGQIIK